MRRIRDNFAHFACDVRNEMPAILRRFGAQSAANLRNAPLANAPFSGFSKEQRIDRKALIQRQEKLTV